MMLTKINLSKKLISNRNVKVFNAKYITSINDFKDINGAYATNEIVIFNKNPNEDKIIVDILNNIKLVSSKYYNLKSLKFYAPYSIIEGEFIKEISSLYLPITELTLDIFGFHTPIKDMWIHTNDIKLKSLDISFTDGIAMPNSCSDILIGLEKNKHLHELTLSNKSPHKPLVKIHHKLKSKIVYTKGINIKYSLLF